MNTHNQGDERMVVEIRVRGENDNHQGHEWSYLQIWDKDVAAKFLRAQMRKSETDSQRLLRSYERFHVEVTMNQRATASPTVPDEGLAKAG